jgi:hypothetical protein
MAAFVKVQPLSITRLLTFSQTRLLRPAPSEQETMPLLVRVPVLNEIMLIVSILDKLLACLNIPFKCYLFQRRPSKNKLKELTSVQKDSRTEIGYQMFSINQCDRSPVLTHLEAPEKLKN